MAFAIVMFITYNDLLVDIDHRNVATQQLQGSNRATSKFQPSIISSSGDVGEDKERKIRVLIARTVSSAEIPNVVADVKRINSYRNSNHQQRDELIEESISQCSTNVQSYTDQLTINHTFYQMNETSTLSKLGNGFRSFPNKILCHAANPNTNFTMMNYFHLVHVNFVFFARNGDVALELSNKLVDDDDDGSVNNLLTVDIIDVSLSPAKIWSWLNLIDEERLTLPEQSSSSSLNTSEYYNYVWMIDGDIILRSLNWQAFWQQIHLIRPRIAQPVPVYPNGYPGTKHSVLWHQNDIRVIAGETAIVEIMMPLIDVRTWLGYRAIILNQSEEELLQPIRSRGEDCFDLAWCHYARHGKDGMLSEQTYPQSNMNYNPNSPHFEYDIANNNGGGLADAASSLPSDASSTTNKQSAAEAAAAIMNGFHNRSCVILYQLPVEHGNGLSLSKNKGYRDSGVKVRLYLKRNFHIRWAVQTVYETLSA